MPVMLPIAQAAPVIVPAPPPIYVPSTTRVPPDLRAMAATRYRVEVEVRSPEGVLWSGPLTLAYFSNATVRREQSEASDVPASRSSAFSLSLAMRNPVQVDGPTVGVTVHWMRPGEPSCGYPPSSRTVELAQAVPLPAAGSAILNGDGGLEIRLRRR